MNFRSFYENRVFPHINDVLTQSFIKHRKRLLRDTSGHVLEIGFGTGLSLDAIHEKITTFSAVDPNFGMISKNQERVLRDHPFALNLHQGFAEELPLDNQSVDAVMSILTLCTVSDLDQSISEIKRVLKPQGSLFFLEHVGQKKSKITRKIQNMIRPAWEKIACGCQSNRDTLDALKTAGFEISELKTIGYDGFPNFLSPILRGKATSKSE